MKSLLAQGHLFSNSNAQLEKLNADGGEKFAHKLQAIGLNPLKPTGIDIFQMNMGKMCNQVCKHCHVDAGPDRKEIMTRETMQLCHDVLAQHPEIQVVDLTGGAPEMNPEFRWFVEEASKLGKHIMVRCNLTIILANKKYHDLPEFFAKHKIEVFLHCRITRQAARTVSVVTASLKSRSKPCKCSTRWATARKVLA